MHTVSGYPGWVATWCEDTDLRGLPVDIKMSLGLPGEALSIPVIRRVLGDALHTLGVVDTCVGDIQVAVAEACTNVLDHAGPDDEYEVVAAIEGANCVLKIVDRGAGFDPDDAGGADASPEDEHGRGIQLMRALVDDVVFDSAPEEGTVVYLRKELTWREDASLAAPAGR